jgi:prepilin signal peptidase PulO-like enzyme (type II secretory pathway)
MTLAITIFFLVFGLIIGSFLNVVIFRLNTHRSFGGRSACMVCKKKLNWHELIPVFSFLFLKGRCAGCKTRISMQYPVVEAITGLIFAGLFLKFENLFYISTGAFAVTLAFYGTVFSLLVVIAAYDLRHKIIPDMLALCLAVIAFVGLFLFNNFGFFPHIPSIWEFLSGIILAAPFAIFWLVSKGKWMGLGDAKLMIGLGWVLGLSRGLSGIVLAFWIGAIFGLLLMIFSRKKYSVKSEVPFAPFLVLGGVLAFLFELHLFVLNIM